MYDYVIVHASYGHPFEHWTPWLFRELTSKGKKVLAPQFPCGYDEQTFTNWAKVMDSYNEFIDEHTIFIGHSIGPAFICDYLASREMRANKLFLIAPLHDSINVPDYDHVNSTFFNVEEFRNVKDLVNNIICYISKTDPYVPNALSEWFAKEVNASIKYFEDAGHFNTDAGYITFQELLDDIL